MLQKSVKIVCYGVYLLLITIFFDVVILRYLLGFGYPSHLEQENVLRYPAPYIEFKGKPGVNGHNEQGFLGPSLDSTARCDFKIAFLGGSTGYNGNPPIAKLLEQELEDTLQTSVTVANYSILSSNHRQHIHLMLEYLYNVEADMILFYGGFNETIQSGYYDPRPGYPYNFYYRGETGPLKKVLVEYSAVLGELDQRTGIFTGWDELHDRYQPFSEAWNKTIVDYYFETLDTAERLSGPIKATYFDHPVFLAFYQPYQVPEKFKASHQTIKKRADSVDYLYDVSNLYDSFGPNAYTDIVHVQQYARQAMAEQMRDIVVSKFPPDALKSCPGE